jgi:hypothetical protein
VLVDVSAVRAVTVVDIDVVPVTTELFVVAKVVERVAVENVEVVLTEPVVVVIVDDVTEILAVMVTRVAVDMLTFAVAESPMLPATVIVYNPLATEPISKVPVKDPSETEH